MRTTADANATGVDAGDGDDGVTTLGSIAAASSSTIVISATGVTVAGAGGFDATMAASARASAIDGGAGDDEIQNAAALGARATASLSSSGGSTVVFGSSGADGDSGAVTDVAAIRAGADSDEVWNTGSIDARSTATLSLSSSSFTFGGAGSSGGRLSASTRTAGIRGDAGDDKIVNEGGITANATSSLTSGGGSTVIFGASSGGANAGAFTDAVAIDGGAGDDTIRNAAALVSSSTATMSLSASSFSFGGASGANGTLSASTRSTGIGGGSGDDKIKNDSSVTVSATSSLSSSGGSNVAFGATSAGATSGAFTQAIGLDGGDGDDYLRNRGNVSATSTATLSMSGSSFAFGGAGGTDGTLGATTRATGMAGGAGEDAIVNEGAITVANTSTLTSSGGSSAAFGTSGASAAAGAFTLAHGIDAGSDDDYVHNQGTIGVSSVANLTLSGSSYTFGGTGDVSGDLSAQTQAFGIQGGSGNDYLRSDGDISVTASSNMTSSGRVNTTFGTSASDAVATTDTNAIGIDGGSGDDTIKNFARVDVSASADVTSTNSSYVFGGTSSTAGVVKAFANASGLRGGSGHDAIYNAGEVDVNVSAGITGTGSSHAEFGGSSASGEVVASLIGRGADLGDGDDRMLNEGSIAVTATAGVSSSHNTDTGFLFGGGDSVTRARATMTVYGVDAGEGENALLNKGVVRLSLFGSVSASASSDGADIFDGDAFSRADATFSATAIGIRAGGGADDIGNTGTIEIDTWRAFTFPIIGTLEIPSGASSNAHADGDGIDGDGTARSFATTSLTATGIDAGGGANTIYNGGLIDVDLRVFASASASADSDAGGSTSITRVGSISANGFGIRSGSGDDVVFNDGTINVRTQASNNTGSGHISAGATGIDTGAGNDTIINQGTITTTRIVNGVSTPGTAINAGAGDDLVKLLDGSVTNGNIDLGSGSDSLSLEGTPVINGSIFDALSTVSLIFNNNGYYGGGLPGVTAIKNGAGTFSLSMLNRMERIEVNQGTLQLNSDYRFLADGEFQAAVYGDGSHGRFQVNGETTLDGKMTIVRGGGVFRNGTGFDVLQANQGIETGSSFNAVELPAATPLLRFHAQQRADSMHVDVDVASFTTVAQGANDQSVARHLDRLLSAPNDAGGAASAGIQALDQGGASANLNGELGYALGEVQALGSGEHATAYFSLSPETYANYSVATLATVQQYTGLLQDRMSAWRAMEPTLTARGAGAVEPVWVRPYGQVGGRGADDGLRGYDYNLTGYTLGLDRRVGARATVGFSSGVARNEMNTDRDISEGLVDSRLFSFYGSYFVKPWYVDGVLTYSRNDYETRRDIVIGSTFTRVAGRFQGQASAATVGTGSYVALGQWSVNPFVALNYTRVQEDGFAEDGSGAGLIVDDRATTSLVSSTGLRFSRLYRSGTGGAWKPEFSLAWAHDFDIDDQSVNASYVDAPNDGFTIQGRPMEKNGAVLGLGLGYRGKDGLGSFVKYHGEFRGEQRTQALFGELRFEF